MKQQSTDGYVTINEATVLYGLSPVWVRRMVHQEKVDFIRVQVGDTKVQRIEILKTSLEGRQTKAHRSDGRTKYTVYMTDAELSTLTELLDEAGLEVPIGRANPPKEQKEKDLKALKDSVATS